MMDYLNTYRRYAYDIDRINNEARYNAKEFITMVEKVFRHDLRLIAEQILNIPVKRHIVMLSGPSSSGKTTAAKKLADEFKRKNVDVKLISMDDFYLGADNVRKLPDGSPDFESVEALDIPLIKQSIKLLSTTGECLIPKYDFKNSRRSGKTSKISLGESSVIIMEGIHALNPIFCEHMPEGSVSKIYVSVKQGIKDNEEYVLTNREIRLIRRVVRDYEFRRTEPKNMLSMWDTVVEGEKKYIRPFRYTGDFTVNSIHIYEPCLLKNTATELLSKIEVGDPQYDTAQHLISSLQRFCSVPLSLVPKNSLMREFTGGGIYIY